VHLFNSHLQGADKKVIPCRILQLFKQPLRMFLMKLQFPVHIIQLLNIV